MYRKNSERTYLAIDLKSFYASCECVERGLDPLKAKLVVADPTRTSKTICLAVTPALKAYGLSGRSRLFEVEQKAGEILRQTGKPLEYIVAPPRMALYLSYSTRIYKIYLKYFSCEDIHVYSIDEVFIDVTNYLSYYETDVHTLAMKVIKNILKETGITATAGIGTNLYLAKIAMDIVAKHIPADKDGVRIATLDEQSYRDKLWTHRPITDFWRVGSGTAKRLSKYFMFSMGDIARMSLKDEPLLYRLFGIDAEILIDHAWGYEPCSIKEIKSYKSNSHSLSTGQVLMHPYTFEKARIIVREMAELLALDLFERKLLTASMNLWICYDRTSLDNNNSYSGPLVSDFYGKILPAPVSGTHNFGTEINSSQLIVEAMVALYDKLVDRDLLIRRIGLCANNTISDSNRQPLLFDVMDFKIDEEKEARMQTTRLEMIRRYGKNALLKGMNYQEGAMTIQRNGQIGGHKA